jgi:PTS system, lactose/cellobiose family IIC component
MMEKFMMVAQKMSSNRYLGAIRDAFMTTIPLTITAAFAILINNVLLANNLPFMLTNPEYYSESFVTFVSQFKRIFDAIGFGGLNWIALMIAVALPYQLSKKSEVESPFQNALIILGVFIALLPQGNSISGGIFESQWSGGFTGAADPSTVSNLGALFSGSNLFTTLIVGILFTEILIKLQSIDAIKITLPEQVPPMVARSFSSLVPSILVFMLAGIISYVLYQFEPLGYSSVTALISGLFQAPFLALARSSFGGSVLMIVYIFFSNFLWVFGLHGPNILSGFATPTLGVLANTNQNIYQNTGNAFHPDLAPFPMGFVDAFIQYGGSGATMGLLIAIFLVSKRDDYKAIAKLSVMPGIFEINEPVTFGMPVVLNPILGIPFTLAPLAGFVVPAIATLTGVIPPVVVAVPWVTPPIINAFLATGASFPAAIVGLINLVIFTLVYLPFVLIANKQAEKEAAANAGE